MVTHDEVRHSVGRKVVYRPAHVPSTERGEEGIITSFNERGAFVRFGADTTSKHCLPELLELIRAPRS